MSAKNSAPTYTIGEEIANSVTHGIGLILAIAALGILTTFSSRYGNAWHIVSCTIFAVTGDTMFVPDRLYDVRIAQDYLAC